MSKRIALLDYIEVDGHDISDFCSAVSFSSEHEQVDVSGFNTTGSDEFLAGKTTQSVTLTVFGAYGSGETWDILYRLHNTKAIATFKWRPDSSNTVSATNPELTGNVQILTWNPGATRGQAESFDVQLSAADAAGLTYTES